MTSARKGQEGRLLGDEAFYGSTHFMTERRRTTGKLTRHMLAQSRVIAKGNRIRDVQRLVETYGGRRSTWVKKSSPRFEIGGHHYEYHWYEHPGIGRVELKRNRVD